MKLLSRKCIYCKKAVYRSKGRINEAKKFGWKTYCSLRCQSKSRNKQKIFRCLNPICRNTFKRKTNKIRSTNLYCSLSCAAQVNNLRFPKRKKVIVRAICDYCGTEFIQEEEALYCSRKCKDKGQIISEEKIRRKIKEFYTRHNRIPLKREFANYHAARSRFGTWNKAISAAGFEPNPVMFAKKYIANDGHKCNSLAEKIIDDWLTSKKIKHKREIPYPGNKSLIVDFVVRDNWIEFFGLHGVINKYDKLVNEKRMLCKKYKLSLIEIYPKDLFPVNRLSEIIKIKNI